MTQSKTVLVVFVISTLIDLVFVNCFLQTNAATRIRGRGCVSSQISGPMIPASEFAATTRTAWRPVWRPAR